MRLGARHPGGVSVHAGSMHVACGFSLVELLVGVGVLGLLLSIAVPAYQKSRATAQRKICIVNLKMIDDAKQQWAIEKRKRDGTAVTAKDILPYMEESRMPACPSKGTYTIRKLGVQPTCTLRRIGHAISNVNMDEDPRPD